MWLTDMITNTNTITPRSLLPVEDDSQGTSGSPPDEGEAASTSTRGTMIKTAQDLPHHIKTNEINPLAYHHAPTSQSLLHLYPIRSRLHWPFRMDVPLFYLPHASVYSPVIRPFCISALSTPRIVFSIYAFFFESLCSSWFHLVKHSPR